MTALPKANAVVTAPAGGNKADANNKPAPANFHLLSVVSFEVDSLTLSLILLAFE